MSANQEIQEIYYPRPQNIEDALQIAIDKWVTFQYRIWEQESQRRIGWYGYVGAFLRIVIFVLAGMVTALSSIDEVSKATVTLVSAGLTILTGVDGFLKLSEKKVLAENRRTEILAEYDRQGYEWMTKVHLETNTETAFAEAKRLLETGPKAVNDIIARYMSRASGNEPTKPQ